MNRAIGDRLHRRNSATSDLIGKLQITATGKTSIAIPTPGLLECERDLLLREFNESSVTTMQCQENPQALEFRSASDKCALMPAANTGAEPIGPSALSSQSH